MDIGINPELPPELLEEIAKSAKLDARVVFEGIQCKGLASNSGFWGGFPDIRSYFEVGGVWHDVLHVLAVVRRRQFFPEGNAISPLHV